MGALFYYFFQFMGWILLPVLVGLVGYAAFNAMSGVKAADDSRREDEAPGLFAKAKRFGLYAIGALGALIVVNTLGGAFVNVPAGHRGVIFSASGGVSPRILTEGIQMITPVVESVKLFDVRTQKADLEGAAATKDQQAVHTKITVWYAPAPGAVQTIYQTLGEDYANNLIPSNVSEVMKAEVARHTALGLLSQREMVASQIRDSLKKKLAGYNVLVDNVAIGNFEFSTEFNKAIEEKQTAEQTALKKTYELQSAQKQAEIVKTEAQGEASAAIAKAEGQAKSARIVAAAISGNANYMELKRLENRESVAKALAGGKNVVYLPSSTIFTMPSPNKGE